MKRDTRGEMREEERWKERKRGVGHLKGLLKLLQ
jgi:hypothetical protein